MLYEVASIAYSPTSVVAVASFLNLKKVEGSSGPKYLKLKKIEVASYLSGVS